MHMLGLRPRMILPSRALTFTLAFGLAPLLTAGAHAQDAPPAPAAGAPANAAGAPATATTGGEIWSERVFKRIRCQIDCPKDWVATESDDGVRFDLEQSGPGLVTIAYWPGRRDLDEVAAGLRAEAVKRGWTVAHDLERRTLDGREVVVLVCDLTRPNLPEEEEDAEEGAGPDLRVPAGEGAKAAPPSSITVRQLYCVIDAAPATYLLTYGADGDSFDRPLAERLIASFDRAGAPDHDHGAAAAAPAPGPVDAAVPHKPYGCAACDREQPRDQSFCDRCGGGLTELPRFGCAACESVIDDEAAKFCSQCGKALGAW